MTLLRKDPDQRNYLVSNKKIESRGIKPSISLDEGIEELVKGLQILTHTIYIQMYNKKKKLKFLSSLLVVAI